MGKEPNGQILHHSLTGRGAVRIAISPQGGGARWLGIAQRGGGELDGPTNWEKCLGVPSAVWYSGTSSSNLCFR